MKKIVLLVMLIVLSACLYGYALDPITEYKTSSDLKPEDILYRWTASISDAGSIVLISTKQDYKDERHDGIVPAWTIYVPINNNSDYLKLSGSKSLDGNSDFSEVSIDPEKLYVGLIKGFGKKGIVTAQVDHPKKGPAVGYVYPYTLEGNYMRQTLLAKFDPDKSNAVYDQYLAEDKRTKVQLEEINL